MLRYSQSNIVKSFLLVFLLQGCIGTDLVFDTIDVELRYIEFIDVLGSGDSFTFEAGYFNNVGIRENVDLGWKSSDTSVADVDNNGVVLGKNFGEAIITVCYNGSDTSLQAMHTLRVDTATVMQNNSRTGTIRTTSSYALRGDFELIEESGGGLTLSFASNYQASTSLPGLYIYMTNNPSTTSGSYEIGPVQVFNGVHQYSLPSSIGLNDYQYVLYFCKPFNVKVGDGRIN